jgi:hypothetical protein
VSIAAEGGVLIGQAPLETLFMTFSQQGDIALQEARIRASLFRSAQTILTEFSGKFGRIQFVVAVGLSAQG